MKDWRGSYAALAERITAGAPGAQTLYAGFNTCVDQVYRLDGAALDRLSELDHPLTREAVDRIARGGDGEIFMPAPALAPALDGLLGEPLSSQVGGTGAQAAWTLAKLGAPSVLSLTDRSPAQLAVLDPAIGLCSGGAIVPVSAAVPRGIAAAPHDGSTAPQGASGKPPHYILEYSAGTRWRGGTVSRSSRIIVRLADDGIERDEEFAALAPDAGAGLVSGLNALSDDDTESRRWLRDLVGRWRDGGLPMIHLELAEYPRAAALAEVAEAYAGVVHSLGLSLAELAMVSPGGDPPTAARELALRYQLKRVCVHADTWSLLVHRGDPETAAAAIRGGNLLAAARARRGSPTADLAVSPDATFTDDLPASEPLGDGWHAECAPTPYLAHPAATIGLGDTFVAGLLLATCL
jgi:ADP-dependent phosphofructokinase/glucokinase